MLNLQAANRASTYASSSADVDSIVFNRAVGSLGASISPDHFTADEPEENEGESGICNTGNLAVSRSESQEARSEDVHGVA